MAEARRSRGKLWSLVRKDLVVEWRSKEVLGSTLFFAVLVLLVFNFGLETVADRAAAGAGLLWVAFLFAGMLGMNRLFVAEMRRGGLQGLMLCPIDRTTLYFAKCVSLLLFLLVTGIATVGLYVLFFNVALGSGLLSLGLVLLLGCIGLAALGTTFAAMAVRTRARELMLPMLLVPITVPLLMASVRCTGEILAGRGLAAAAAWVQLLVAFDVIFLAVGWITFPAILEE